MRSWSIRGGVACGAVALAVATLAVPAQAMLVRGTPGDDRLIGRMQADTVSGRAGDDHLRGGMRNDLVVGGFGDDVLGGGPGFDELRGLRGNDVILARDGQKDLIRCGAGFDTVYIDVVEDGIFGCERISYE